MKDITQCLQDATNQIWSNQISREPHWIHHDLITGSNEKQIVTLYVHLLKNDSADKIWDNNGKSLEPNLRKRPKIVAFQKSYMLKWGISKHGIINRRRLDFKDHYHIRPSHIYHPYKIPLSSPIFSNLKVGSSNTLLHLFYDLKDYFTEQNRDELYEQAERLEQILTIRFREIFSNGNFLISDHGNAYIPAERINIPIENNEYKEEELIKKIKEVFVNLANEI